MSEKEKQKESMANEKKHVQYELLNLSDKMLETDNFDQVFKSHPVTEDTKCGFGLIQGSWLQIFANKKAFVFFYGVVGSIFAATYAYFNGTITTIEKRYKIPSRNTGMISVGNDISSLFISAILAYYAGKGHRPRWIACGLFAIVLFCFLTALPHFLYGSGDEADKLTVEYGGEKNLTVVEMLKKQSTCRTDLRDGVGECDKGEGNLAPQIILFIGQLVAGVGQSLYYTLGTAYIDDNVKKSKTPALISLSYFLRLLGPAGGYALASFCLKIYISPDLTPTIDNTDPRWLGAWWLGWLVLGVSLFAFAFVMCMFPKQLPRAALRKRIASERRKRGMKKDDNDEEKEADEIPASIKDMFITFRRLLGNIIYMLNNLASIFYYFGYMPYWIFTPKYIELQYKQSASTSSLVTGTVALVFSAMGILSSGIVISKFKPRARSLALWNVFVGFLSIIGMIGYTYLGCDANENSVILNTPLPGTETCNSNCNCDYVKYSPVCGSNNLTYISACHAGCKSSKETNGTKTFQDCSCIANENSNLSFSLPESLRNSEKAQNFGGVGSAVGGPCPVDCNREFILFLIVMCFIKFTSATGRASNFLVSVRCVKERDKTVSMGFGLMFMCLFSFMPSPIFFGALFDKFCIVWGKTCNGKGNCWLYDGESLRYWMNYIASAFVTVGVLFDAGVWFYVKDLKIFDEKTKTKEIEIVALDKKQQENDEKTLTLSVNEKNEKKIVNYD